MPKRADAGPSIDVEIDVDQKYIVEVMSITEAQAQWDSAKADEMSLTWKFRLFDQATGAVVIDNNGGDAYELWNFTNDNTYRNDKTGKAAKAREWTEALVGRQLTNDEMNEFIDLGFEGCLKGKRGLADIEWYTTKTGNERLKIIRLRPYKKGQAAAEESAAPASESRPTEDIAARRKRLGLDDAAYVMMAETAADSSSMLDQALAYLGQGRSVFPVCSPIPGTARCLHHQNCTSPGKVALVKWKPYQEQRPSEADLRSWWGRNPTANIAMATGPASGVDVVDLDGELATREAFKRGLGNIGPVAFTGRIGGRHVWFAHRPDAPTVFAQTSGIDFRGYGGYVLLPPSLHHSGAHYKWSSPPDGEPLPELPRWIDELAAQGKSNGHVLNGTSTLDVSALLLEGVAEGSRDDTLFRLAAKLRGLGIPYDIAIDVVERSADRCSPPFPLDQARAKVDSAYRRYEPNPEGSKPIRLGGTVAPTQIPDTWARPISALLEQAETDVDWLVDQLFSVGSSGFIAAEPKVGKSWVALDLAYCLATGCKFLDRFEIARPRRVLFIEEEDPERRLIRRLKRLYRGNPDRGQPPDDMWRIVVRSGFRLDDTEWMVKLRAELEDFRPEVVFLDVFNKLHLKDENSQPEMSAILHDLAALTREFGCAFIIVHHYRKSGIGQSQRGNQMLRGHSSLAGYSECSLYLKKGQGHKIVCDPESKDAPELDQFEIRLTDTDDDGTRLTATETPTRVREGEDEQVALDAVDALTGDGKDVEALAIAEVAGWDRSKASRTLNRLVLASKLDVETVKRGRTKFRFYTRVHDGIL